MVKFRLRQTNSTLYSCLLTTAYIHNTAPPSLESLQSSLVTPHLVTVHASGDIGVAYKWQSCLLQVTNEVILVVALAVDTIQWMKKRESAPTCPTQTLPIRHTGLGPLYNQYKSSTYHCRLDSCDAHSSSC